MITVAVLGAGGRMGSEVCRAVAEDPDLSLGPRIGRGDTLDALGEGGATVAVDFTTPAVVKENIRRCLGSGLHAVVGTTGLQNEDLEEVAHWCDESSRNVIVAPNFAVGAVLMMGFARQASSFFERAEIVERHHEKKLDAPSGTALRTARLMSEGRSGRPWPAGTESETVEESRGLEAHGIRIHSLRLPGSVAHQEVILGSPGETLTIRHDSLDRSSFMPGVLLAVKKVGELPGLTVGLEPLLGL